MTHANFCANSKFFVEALLGKIMKKMSIIRFRPKAGQFENFLNELVAYHEKGAIGVEHRWFLRRDDELIAVVIRDEQQFTQSAEAGVSFLDSVRHMLEEFNEVDRHTIPLTGDILA